MTYQTEKKNFNLSIKAVENLIEKAKDIDPTLNNYFASGYINVTAAITEIQFKMTSGNLDGTIKMYGIAS